MVNEDVSSVRAHQGGTPNTTGARAYAGGSDIHLGAGQAGAGAAGGKSLLAHELSHVGQQGAVKSADIQAAVGHYAK